MVDEALTREDLRRLIEGEKAIAEAFEEAVDRAGRTILAQRKEIERLTNDYYAKVDLAAKRGEELSEMNIANGELSQRYYRQAKTITEYQKEIERLFAARESEASELHELRIARRKFREVVEELQKSLVAKNEVITSQTEAIEQLSERNAWQARTLGEMATVIQQKDETIKVAGEALHAAQDDLLHTQEKYAELVRAVESLLWVFDNSVVEDRNFNDWFVVREVRSLLKEADVQSSDSEPAGTRVDESGTGRSDRRAA